MSSADVNAPSPPSSLLEASLVRATEVRQLLGGITDKTLWNWLRDESGGFPQPIKFKGRRYWRLADIEDFARRRFSAAAA